MRLFFHVNDRQSDSVVERQSYLLQGHISSFTKEFRASQRSSHFKPRKTGSHCSRFAGVKNLGANASPRPVRVDKECANLGCIVSWVKQIVLALSPAISAIERLALAPSAAARQNRTRSPLLRFHHRRIVAGKRCFSHKISAISNQLAVYTKN